MVPDPQKGEDAVRFLSIHRLQNHHPHIYSIRKETIFLFVKTFFPLCQRTEDTQHSTLES